MTRNYTEFLLEVSDTSVNFDQLITERMTCKKNKKKKNEHEHGNRRSVKRRMLLGPVRGQFTFKNGPIEQLIGGLLSAIHPIRNFS